MSKSMFTNISIGLFVGLVLAFYTTNVEGVNLEEMRTIYSNFFNELEGIIPGNPQTIIDARNTYNDCATRAVNYRAIINCAIAAFNTYDTSLRPVFRTKAHEIVNAFNTFYNALHAVQLPETERGVQIPALLQLTFAANEWIQTGPNGTM